ncbi:MAG: hypothetical protein M3Q07_11340 [Pseudobdellovibrionaceae bacterium]|nr:hypothetical protein [Pseudobdellovibrionaceae bacterium]
MRKMMSFLFTVTCVSTVSYADITCRSVEPIADLSYQAEFVADLTKAKINLWGFTGLEVEHELNVCTTTPKGEGFDLTQLTVCNDVNWTDSFEIHLTTGGYTGIPLAKLYSQTTAGKELLSSLICSYK